MSSLFSDTAFSRLKKRVRKLKLIHVIRPTHIFLLQCKDLVLDQVAKVGPGISQRLLLASFPKSGTHLLLETLRMIPGLGRWPLAFPNCDPVPSFRRKLKGMARNRFAIWHYGANKDTLALARELDLSVIVMLRDPRDIVVSYVDYVTHLDAHVMHAHYKSLPDFKARAKCTMQGVPKELKESDAGVRRIATNNPTYPGVSDLGACCRAFLEWENYPRALFVKYEDLVGERGGGSRERQRKTMRRILDFVGVQLEENEMTALCEKIYNPKSCTFNKGVAGRWKELFDEELKTIFKQTAGAELIRMGFEKDNSW